MKVNGQTKVLIDYIGNGQVFVSVWHGKYTRENKPEDFILVRTFEMPAYDLDFPVCKM